MMSGAPASVIDVMTEFGELIGVAFQLADDLLDVSSDSSDSGKTPGTDLREGVRTLPVLHALESADPRDDELRGLLGEDLSDDVRLGRALRLLRASDAMDRSRQELQRHADAARRSLQSLPGGPAKAALESLCVAVVSRSG
jgi:heptaprenyl diphosphate synthase